MKIDGDKIKQMVKGLSADPKRDCYVYALCSFILDVCKHLPRIRGPKE